MISFPIGKIPKVRGESDFVSTGMNLYYSITNRLLLDSPF